MTTQQPAPQYAAPQPRNGFGITALVLAIVGLVFGFVPLTGFIAVICGGLAVLFAGLGYSRKMKGVATNGKMSVTGGILGLIAFALGIIGIVIVFNTFNELDKQLGGVSPMDSASGSAPDSALKDVTVNTCEIKAEYGMSQAVATVVTTNNTDSPQSYWTTIAVNGPNGNRLGEIHTISNSLAPGQKTTASGMKASAMIPDGTESVTCKIAEVNRTPA